MKKTPIKICKKCGKQIYIIPEKLYRSIIVDADAVPVIADPLGDEYVKPDGKRFKARALKFDEFVDGEEYAYRPHSWTCGVEE